MMTSRLLSAGCDVWRRLWRRGKTKSLALAGALVLSGCTTISESHVNETIRRYRETPFGKEKEACLALFFIGRVGHDVAAPELLRRFGRTPYAYDRILLVRAAGYCKPIPIQYRPIFVAACQDEHELVQVSAYLELVESGEEWERELLDELAVHHDRRVRTLAAKARAALPVDERRREYIEETMKDISEREGPLYGKRYRR